MVVVGPEPLGVTLVRDDVINVSGWCDDAQSLAVDAQWVTPQEPFAVLAPLAVVPALMGVWPWLFNSNDVALGASRVWLVSMRSSRHWCRRGR